MNRYEVVKHFKIHISYLCLFPTTKSSDYIFTNYVIINAMETKLTSFNIQMQNSELPGFWTFVFVPYEAAKKYIVESFRKN
jgi:hypothetical protein